MATLTFCDICGVRKPSSFVGFDIYMYNEDGTAKASHESLDICEKCFKDEYERICETKKGAQSRAIERLEQSNGRGTETMPALRQVSRESSIITGKLKGDGNA